MSNYSVPKSKMIDEQMFALYLADNPDFFTRHPELVSQLSIPHVERGAVSLVEIQLTRLREKVSELEEEITQLMSIAAANETVYRAISQIQTDLFTVSNEMQLQNRLAKLADSLALSVSLRFFTSEQYPLQRAEVKRIKTSHFAGQSSYLGRLKKADAEVFLRHPPELGSFLLMPILVKGKEVGFLSFASQDGGHFQPQMNTLFIEQLAEQITALYPRFQGKK